MIVANPAWHTRVRPAAQAGRFYPAEPDLLAAELRDYLAAGAESAPAEAPPLAALIVPHAGYLYSGAVAGAAFARLANQTYDRVLLIGPSHYGDFAGAALPEAGAFTTPLGPVPLDVAAMVRLARSEGFVFDSAAHMPEHSLEVELPFLQTVLQSPFRLVPLLMGRYPDRMLDTVAGPLAELLHERAAAGERWLVVISSDAYHGYDADDCTENTIRLWETLEKLDSAAWLAAHRAREVMACGWAGIALLLRWFELASAGRPPRLESVASDDSRRSQPSAARKYIVGYVSAAFYQ